MTKALYRTVQIQRHMDNWKELPKSIRKNLNDIANLIRPTDPTDDLVADINTIFLQTGERVRNRVEEHFRERLDTNRNILATVNAADKQVAADTVLRQINRSAGRKVSTAAIEKIIKDEITLMNLPAETIAPLAKRVCRQKTPPTINQPSISTSNRYQPLTTMSDMEENDEAIADTETEEDTAQPLGPRRRKQRPAPIQQPNLEDTENPSTSTALPAPPAPTVLDTFITTQPPQALTTSPKIDDDYSPQHGRKKIFDTASNMATKNEQWRVNVLAVTHTLIISDSNMRLVEPTTMPPGWQLAVLPGARLDHIPDILYKLPATKLTNLILAVGINNRTRINTTPDVMESISALLKKRSKSAFTVGISFNRFRPQPEQDKIILLNRQLSTMKGVHHIPALGRDDTKTVADTNIHHDKDTVSKIWYKVLAAVSCVTATSSSSSASTCTLAKN